MAFDDPDFTRRVDVAPSGSYSPSTGQVAVGTGAVAIAGSGAGRTCITIYNPAASANPVFVGFAGVTATDGFQLDAGHGLSLAAQAQIYAISATGSQTVSFEDE